MQNFVVAHYQLPSYKLKIDALREACELKNVPKSGKGPHFLDPPPPPGYFGIFEFGKNLKFNDPWTYLGEI